MKTINNTCVEVLPGLLDKSKTSTIRKAWKLKPNVIAELAGIKNPELRPYPKPPKYKVGDKVQLMWKQNNHYKRFCKKCGAWMYDVGNCLRCSHRFGFKKLLGNAVITEVFKIEMKYDAKDLGITEIKTEELRFKFRGHKVSWLEDLAKRDGFASAEDMFKYFDKECDLSSPKEFWCYRYRWLE